MTEPLERLPDGTVKQVNPFTGTKVWTLPDRAARPLARQLRTPLPLDPADQDRYCAFCCGRMLETSPEIARLVRTPHGWEEVRGLLAEELHTSCPEFRLIPNLFEILSYDYWHLCHGWHATAQADARRTAYLSTPLGREQVSTLVRSKLRARVVPEAVLAARTFEDDVRDSVEFFAGNHDVVIARRHYVDGATMDTQVAGSGTLTPEEHWHYVRFTIEAARRLYADNPAARYVSIFQNWLSPAGASFDHLHKQLVAIDELSVQTEREAARVREEPELYARWGEAYAAQQGLIVASTPSAVAFAGVGHQYPSLEIHSRDPRSLPWELAEDAVRDFSDLLHACHAATGVQVPTNEEWHHRPPSLDLPMPVRAVIKWRVSTLAGFEGDTKIYVNTIDPWTIRDRVVERLMELSDEGALSPSVSVAG
jgi:galactose-1-phosphate uridylyltransferase